MPSPQEMARRLGVGIQSTGQTPPRPPRSRWFNPFYLGAGAVVGIVLLVTVLSSWFVVQPYERAVVTWAGNLDYVAEPGLHWKLPYVQSTTFYRTDIQSMSSGKGWINTYTIDSQEVDVTFNLFYRIPANCVQSVYINLRDYENQLYKLSLDRMKSAMGQVNTQTVAEKRGEIRDAIRKTMIADMKPYCIDVSDFQLTDLKYTDAFRNAINAAAVQKANVESLEYQRQQAEKSAQSAKIKAIGEADAAREAGRGRADANLLEAKAQAEAIKLKGEAEAAAIRAQSEALKANAGLVDLRRAERWDGRLPQNLYGSAPIPFMGLPSPQ